MEPIGTVKDIPTTPLEDTTEGDTTTPNSGTPAPGSDPCTSREFDDLEEALRGCEVPMPRGADLVTIKDKVAVEVATSAPSTTPGGQLDVLVSLRNRTSERLPLYFTGSPNIVFEVETFDRRGRRADLPAQKWPGYRRGFAPESRPAKAARVTLEGNGRARVKILWEAVKTKWAPERANSWEGRGFPRVRAGALPPGKYSVRPVLPVVGELDTPKVTVEVTRS